MSFSTAMGVLNSSVNNFNGGTPSSKDLVPRHHLRRGRELCIGFGGEIALTGTDRIDRAAPDHVARQGLSPNPRARQKHSLLPHQTGVPHSSGVHVQGELRCGDPG